MPGKGGNGALPGLGIRSSNFGANSSFFAKKVSDLSDLLTIAHSFWAICSLRSEGMSETFAFFKLPKNCNKRTKNTIFFANRSAFVSKRENEWFAKTPERFAYSLICHERPERIVHICSFVMSDLSDFYHSCSFVLSKSLTFAHLSWAMSKWANSQPWALLLVELFSSCQLKGEMGLSYWWISSVVVRQRGEMGLSYIGESVQ